MNKVILFLGNESSEGTISIERVPIGIRWDACKLLDRFPGIPSVSLELQIGRASCRERV